MILRHQRHLGTTWHPPLLTVSCVAYDRIEYARVLYVILGLIYELRELGNRNASKRKKMGAVREASKL